MLCTEQELVSSMLVLLYSLLYCRQLYPHSPSCTADVHLARHSQTEIYAGTDPDVGNKTHKAFLTASTDYRSRSNMYLVQFIIWKYSQYLP